MNVPLAQLVPGTIVGGDYRIVRPLSEGGMGAVYVADQLSTGKQRALKVMHPQLTSDAKLRERFVQEARVGGQIDSDHVVEVVGAGLDGPLGSPWLAMELLKGETLDDLVRRAGPAHAQAREILGQLLHAIGAAHASGIVHRDLKPENVFLEVPRREGAAFTVKVLDFGIAKLVSDAAQNTKHTAAIGTPLWMAPEQTEQRGVVTAATDVWAIGLIAYYLLTGRFYWNVANEEGASTMQLLREVCLEPIEPASSRAARWGARLPAGFDAFFARCVVRDPNARFRDGREVRAALDAALSDAPIATASYAPAPPAHTMAATAPMIAQPIRSTTSNPYAAPIAPAPYGYVPVAPTRSNAPAIIAAITVAAAAAVAGAVVYLRASSPSPSPVAKAERVAETTAEATADPLGSEGMMGEPPASAGPMISVAPPIVSSAPSAAAPASTTAHAAPPATIQKSGAESVGALSVSGRLPPDEINAVVARNRWRFKACYNKALASDPAAAGTVTVKAVIGEDGSVEGASGGGSTNAGLDACVVQAFYSMHFPAPEGGKVSITVPIAFAAKE